ncbi:acetylglutamate kinase [Pseudothermotoga thermarum]|uniref:Acetylglutamate kinase n=1 Tax=Pseudothermotoga thermarum DSM 5069 TaxID=688269 RepID=F7YU14_9THEM|nr:acetylglutamate kinase [Pseudothermotoga thermarum]AEH51596.1 N-acetylglutamate kinase [Pseudothermotoga thermarum DSM 5069]
MTYRIPTILDVLPMLTDLKGKIIVTKIGGSVMRSKETLESFAKDIATMKAFGIKPIVVHGGGPEINQMLEKLGIQTKFQSGYRVTDKETLEVVLMVLAGKTNKHLVKILNDFKANAVGVCGVDANLFECEKDLTFGDIGFVGKIVSVNCDFVLDLLYKGYIPVIATVGSGKDGIYNINADVAAAYLAKALKAEKLIILTDVDGVLVNGEVVKSLTISQAQHLIETSVAKEGMLPKLTGVIDAVKDGVKSVHIINGKIEHAVLLEIFGMTLGTIIKEG